MGVRATAERANGVVQNWLKVPDSRLGLSIALVCISCSLLATHDAFVKLVVADLPSVQLIWMRYIFHTAILLAIIGPGRWKAVLLTEHPVLHGFRTIAILATAFFMFAALRFMPLATGTVLLFLSPVLVTLLSSIFLGETIGPRRYMAVLVGFAGVVVVINPGFGTLEPSMLLPVAGAFGAAIYVMLTRRLSGKTETLPTMILCPLACAVLLAPAQLFFWQPPTMFHVLMAVLMGGCGALGHALLQFGLRGASAAVLSPFLYTQVAFAAVLSVLVFNDPLAPNLVIGIILIVGSGIAIWWFQQDRKRKPAAACANQ